MTQGLLRIRHEQMRVLQRAPRQRFENELASYATRYFPFEAAHADLTRWVRTAVESAAGYGFLTQYEAALYLALSAMLGSGFDEDPQIPWARSALAHPGQSSVDRLKGLYDTGLEFLDATGGPRCCWLVRAKIRVRRQDVAALDRAVHPRALPQRIRDILERLYPQKAAAVGDAAMTQLVTLAIARAKQRGATSSSPALIHAIHMFYLGSEFDRDPCYPWASACLGDHAGEPAEQRYRRMHQQSLAYLDRSFQFKS